MGESSPFTEKLFNSALNLGNAIAAKKLGFLDQNQGQSFVVASPPQPAPQPSGFGIDTTTVVLIGIGLIAVVLLIR